jgi:hypothetical protein
MVGSPGLYPLATDTIFQIMTIKNVELDMVVHACNNSSSWEAEAGGSKASLGSIARPSLKTTNISKCSLKSRAFF